jgi:hypothetical protein
MGHFDSKSEIENYVRSLPLCWTITRPASFIEMLMLPGMGLNTGNFSFFMQRNQPMQMITLDDLGRINARILCNPQQFAGKVLEISSQTLTGEDLERAFSNAAGFPIHYQRFPDALLTQNSFLRRLTELVDNGIVAGVADIPALEKMFGEMMKLDQWLTGPGNNTFRPHLTPHRLKSRYDKPLSTTLWLTGHVIPAWPLLTAHPTSRPRHLSRDGAKGIH